jgi:hypothetical protein
MADNIGCLIIFVGPVSTTKALKKRTLLLAIGNYLAVIRRQSAKNEENTVF